MRPISPVTASGFVTPITPSMAAIIAPAILSISGQFHGWPLGMLLLFLVMVILLCLLVFQYHVLRLRHAELVAARQALHCVNGANHDIITLVNCL